MDYSELLRSHIIEGHKSKLIQQNDQIKLNFNSLKQNVKESQLSELKSKFMVERKEPHIQLGAINREEYYVTFKAANDQISFPVRLYIEGDFPESNPRFFLEKYYKQDEYLDTNTLEINYSSVFRWNSKQPKLLELTQTVQNLLKNKPPQFDDGLVEWGENVQKELKQVSGCPQLGGLTLKKLFPYVLPENQDSEYFRYQKSPELVNQQIQCLPEYLDIIKCSKVLADSIGDLSNTISNKFQPLEKLRAQIQAKWKDLEKKQDEYVLLHSQLSNIQERFELQGAFAIIDCEIQSIDEKVNECFSNRFQNQIPLPDRCKIYMELKKQQNYLNYLKKCMGQNI